MKKEKKSDAKGRLGTIVVTAVVTSLFWATILRTGPGVNYPSATPTAQIKKPSLASPSSPSKTDVVAKPGPAGLIIPVVGVSASVLTDTWGDARAQDRSHEAIDIMAPRGTQVIAAAPGTVEKIFESEPGGHTVYIRSNDGGWVYYYAHLDSYAPGLAEGQRIARGDPIGGVGDTGNAGAGNTHLHFAINRMGPKDAWYQGTAINPYPLLAGRPGKS